MDTVFDMFPSTEYTFLQIARGGVAGNAIVSQTEATGVFKLRSQMIRNPDSEVKQSNATLHVRPDEPFLSENDDNLVGHGIRVEGKDYEIIGYTGGQNFDEGVREHYTATLQEADFSDYEESS